MRKIKTLLFAVVFVVFGAAAFAADATVTYVSGKVEVQRNGKWVALQKGDTVAKSETISTGFQSEAKIKILDSVMYLGPVTRITLEELSSTDQKDNVNVYLKTGTARSQVNHVDTKRVNYQVHTAVAVASCRGTEWIIYDSNTIDCFDGIVAVAAYIADDEFDGSSRKAGEGDETGETPTSADGVLVQANQSVTVSETNSVSAPVNNVVKVASNVTGTVGTAASKESEGGAGIGGGLLSDAGGDSSADFYEIAAVNVILELPDEDY